MRNLEISSYIFALFAALLLSGCSFLVDFSECESDDDCTAGACVDQLCVATGCTTSAECASGETCQASQCVALQKCATTSECDEGSYCLLDTCRTIDPDICPRLAPVFEEDANFIPIGAILPLSGPNAAKGNGTTDGAELALSEINAAGAVGSYRFGLIGCDSRSDDDAAVAAAAHLTYELGVEAIVGAGTSGETIAVAQNVTVESETLLISPAATSPAISELPDDGLVWRTIASDVLQGPALARRALESNADGRIAVLFAENTYGRGLFELVTAELEANGFPTGDESVFFSARYEIDQGALSAGTIDELGPRLFGPDGFEPNVVMILGSVESEQIISSFESTYDLGQRTTPPTWVLTEAGKQGGLLQMRLADVWSRITGTSIQQTDGPAYQAFQLNYSSTFGNDPQDFPFADKAYDAAYLIGFGYGAAGEPTATTGPGLAEQLAQLSTGTEIRPGTNSFNSGVATLAAEGSADYVGASGSVDFDNSTGDVQSDIEAWEIVTVEGDAQFESAGKIE